MSPARIIPQPTELQIAASAAPFTLWSRPGSSRRMPQHPSPRTWPASCARRRDTAPGREPGRRRGRRSGRHRPAPGPRRHATRSATRGYRLVTAATGTTITAATPAGLFYGVQSLRQLFPADVERRSVQSAAWQAAAATIIDQPALRLAWRHARRRPPLLRRRRGPAVHRRDRRCSRSTCSTCTSPTTRAGGSRSPAGPSSPRVGASTEVGGGPGGFYTEEDYASIVAYAAERFVTVVPEIDVPGHTNAALSAYPELNADGVAREPYTGIDVGFSSLDVDSDATWEFLDDVFRSVAAQTPGPYLHIGGDESHTTPPERLPRLHRAGDRARRPARQDPDRLARGRTLSPISPPGTIGQYWSYVTPQDNAAELAAVVRRAGRLADPLPRRRRLPRHRLRRIRPRSARPGPADRPACGRHTSGNRPTSSPASTENQILGVEAPLWTETVADTGRHRLPGLPAPRRGRRDRLVGGAVGVPGRSWDGFSARLDAWYPRFRALGIGAWREGDPRPLAPEPNRIARRWPIGRRLQ